MEDATKCIECRSKFWVKVNGFCICSKNLRLTYYENKTVDGICVDSDCSKIDPNCV